MNRITRPGIAALAIIVSANAALAQAVVIAPEQETVIKEYVTKQKVTSVDVPNVTVSVGGTLPETVELHKVDVPNVSYSYVVVNGKTVLVEPKTRKIVRIMG
jgi:ABC-type Fe3+-hydroxamate transport system substrate-binding protein